MRDKRQTLSERHIGPSRGAKFRVFLLFFALMLGAAYLWNDGWPPALASWIYGVAKVIGANGPMLEDGVSIAALVLFGAGTIASVLDLTRRSRDIVVLSGDGIHDRRISLQQISWRAIQAVSTGRLGDDKVVVLEIEPAILETLELPSDLVANRKLGVKGVPVSARGLGISFFRLRRLISRYHREANASCR